MQELLAPDIIDKFVTTSASSTNALITFGLATLLGLETVARAEKIQSQLCRCVQKQRHG